MQSGHEQVVELCFFLFSSMVLMVRRSRGKISGSGKIKVPRCKS